jgi:hypothetical protein
VATGAARVDRAPDATVLRPGRLLYLDAGREQVAVSAAAGSRLFLLGGVPLGEPLLMWWNLVARTPEEIEAAVADWREGRFGTVPGYDGEPLTAPPMVRSGHPMGHNATPGPPDQPGFLRPGAWAPPAA